jgi:hypothetical protein
MDFILQLESGDLQTATPPSTPTNHIFCLFNLLFTLHQKLSLLYITTSDYFRKRWDFVIMQISFVLPRNFSALRSFHGMNCSTSYTLLTSLFPLSTSEVSIAIINSSNWRHHKHINN